MANKKLGYILVGVGFLIALFSYSGIRALIGISIPTNFSDLYFMIAGVVLVFIGAFLAFKRKNEVKEVPIYQGKKIVGYRVIKED